LEEEVTMSMKDKTIRIDDWAGNILFIGPYDDPGVDKVLNANRCKCDHDEDCLMCNGTGYRGDFAVEWIDDDHDEKENVYEYINY
jgi:hypothetical protein